MNPVGKLTGNLLIPLAGVRDGRFLDAAMAASALVANADGAVSRAERGVLEKVFSTVEELKAFDIDLAVNSFNAFAHGICSQGEPGRARAIRAVSEMSGDAEGARLVIRIGCAVARTNDDFSPAERERIGLIAAAAGIAVPEICGKPLEYGNIWGRQPHVITLASAKGGTGKSTTALHLVVGLLKLGHRVGSIDLDGRQGTLSRYLTNRASWAVETGQELAMPRHKRIEASRQANRDLVEQDEQAGFTKALGDMTGCTYVVIDTPGNDSHIARLGYVQADTLITPLNDSFLDIDILARIDRRKREVLGPSEYCKMIWRENDRRVASDRPPIDWIVMRNRLAHVDTRNNREILSLLRQLAQRIGFRLEHGLSERVVFRELFLKGLTLLDLPEDEAEGRDQASHMNARREIDDLLQAVGALG